MRTIMYLIGDAAVEAAEAAVRKVAKRRVTVFIFC